MWKECNNNGPEMLDHLKLLKKVIGNILKDTYDPKFRTLKKEKAPFRRTIFEHPSVMSFMKGIGFVPEN